jgi:hypothetical protein
LCATSTGRDWLNQLQTPDMPRRADAVLIGLALRVAANVARTDPVDPIGPVSLHARGSQGQWIALHGELITGRGGMTQGISVVIGPARPGRAAHPCRGL